MLAKTHLAITLFFVLLFISSISNITSKFVFVFVAFFATLLPDVDLIFSKFGNHKRVLKIFKFFVRHRGFIHSFTFLLAVILFFALFFPVIAFPFFLGYSLHLFADSFTIQGIKPFYPLKKISSWKIKTGGKLEILIFVFFILADLLLLVIKLARIF